jgi:hypothetical protein
MKNSINKKSKELLDQTKRGKVIKHFNQSSTLNTASIHPLHDTSFEIHQYLTIIVLLLQSKTEMEHKRNIFHRKHHCRPIKNADN